MKVIGRQGVLNTVISYVGVAIGYVNTILLFPLFFSPEQYGLTRVMLSLGMLLSQFSQLGLGAVIIKFLPYFKYDRQSFQAFGQYVIKVLLGGIAAVSLLMGLFDKHLIRLYTENAELLTRYFYLLFPLMMFITLYEVVDAYMRAYFKTVFSTFVRDVLIRIITALLILFYQLRWFDFTVFVYLFSSIYLIAFLILLTRFLMLKKKFHERSQGLVRLPRRMMKYMYRYGIYAVLTSAGSMLINNIDVIMLGFLSGLEQVAIYSVAFYISVAVQIPQRGLARIITPVLSVSWKQKDFNNIYSLYRKSSVVLFFFGTLIFSVIWVNIDELFTIMPRQEIYRQGKWVMLLVGISKLIDMVMGVNTEIISVSRYYSFNFYSLVFLVVIAVITNYLFVPMYGVNGAAMATLLSVVLYNLLKLLFIYRRLRMLPFSPSTAYIFLACVLINFIEVYWQMDDFTWSVLSKTLFVLLSYAAVAYWINLKEIIVSRDTQNRVDRN